ncbi:MAG: hypothetical protein ACRDPV_01235 [Gaiellaceae bacterium]
MFGTLVPVTFLGYDLGDLGVAVLIVVVAVGLAFFTATFGYLRAKRAAAERELAPERELENGGRN